MPRAKTPRSETNHHKVVELASAKVSTVNRSQFRPEMLEEEIRQRAYQLYEQRGRTPGRESEDWLLAEREVVARYLAADARLKISLLEAETWQTWRIRKQHRV